jgi:3D (Asp-Asp-Asp) domain-containing protein
MTKNNKTVKFFDIAINVLAFITCAFLIFLMFYCQYLDNQKELNTVIQSSQEELASVVENLELEITKSEQLATELDAMTKSLSEANETILALKSIEYELIYMGEFKLTHYCTELRKHICGTGAGITATGTQVTAGRTIAVDPTVIPYGSQVYIEGYGWRTAEDCGGAVKNKQIDIAVDTHSNALSMGVKSGGVWLLVQKGS